MDVEVTLHFWSLHVTGDLQTRYRAFLSQDETDRMARLVYDKHRDAYLAARGGLRKTLGDEMGMPPEALKFEYGPQGKPALPNGPFFNLSHAGGYACLAIHPTCPLGVDIEAFRPVEEGVAKRFFSPSENASLAAIPAAGKQAGFFRCWTRKEAIIKAIGGGLSIPLDAFDVTLFPDDTPQLIRLDATYGEAPDWALAHIEMGAGMVGAVAAKTNGARLRLRIVNAPDELPVSV